MAAKKILVAAVGTGGTQRNIIQNENDDLSGFKRTILRGLVRELKKNHPPARDFNIDYVEEQPGIRFAEAVRNAIKAAEAEPEKPDLLIFPIGSSARVAAHAATQTLTKKYPTVFVAISDPVEDDAVDSLARPGRNATGVSTYLRQTAHKCLQQFVGNVQKLQGGTVLAMHQPFFPPVVRAMAELRRVARTYGVDLECWIVGDRNHLHTEILPALLKAEEPPRGLLMVPDDLVASEAQEVIRNAHSGGIPVFAPQLEFVKPDREKACALGAFGILGDAVGVEAAEFVHKILWGNENAGNLPVKVLDDEKKYFQFWWNNNVAKQLGCPILTVGPGGPDQVFP